jgi:hypothetical protein
MNGGMVIPTTPTNNNSTTQQLHKDLKSESEVAQELRVAELVQVVTSIFFLIVTTMRPFFYLFLVS